MRRTIVLSLLVPFLVAGFLGLAAFGAEQSTPRADRPNVLWITCEDLSPILGCYGDKEATTPNLDRLAVDGVRYTKAFANAPCCSPARSCLITGVYPSSLGTMHLRSVVPRPEKIPCYTEYLREAGYYCTNNAKEDYQFTTPAAAWDESSGKAHWRGRKPGQPFFAVFNLMVTHQSRVRYEGQQLAKATSHLTAEDRHDPADVPLPPYYPDTPTVRKHVAQLYDLTTEMDYQVGDILAELEEDGLADDTIVFFYSDHGSGIPRGKRWLFDSGIHVPLIIHFPEKYASLAPAPAGSTCDRLVSFVDFPPTMLSILGLPVPEYMEGRAFLGPTASSTQKHIFACRDRVDEVYEFSRCVRDERYKYIRNYYPHRPRMPYSTYSERTPIRGEFRRLAAAGELTGPPAEMMRDTKPAEELYDTWNDPWELNNLADDPDRKIQVVKRSLSKRLDQWLTERRDLAFLPEAETYSRCKEGVTPYEMRLDPWSYPFGRVLQTANLTGRELLDRYQQVDFRLGDPDSAVRYWAAVKLLTLGEDAAPAKAALLKAFETETAPCTRIAEAEVLCRLGETVRPLEVLVEYLDSDDPWVALQAASTLKRLSPLSEPIAPELPPRIAKKRDHFSDMFYDWALEHALRKMGRLP